VASRCLLACLAVLVASACTGPDETTYQRQLFAFGTLVDITLYGVDPGTGRQAVQAVDDMFRQQHHDWHAWQRGALDDVNRAIAAGHSRETEASIIALIRDGQRFERLSGGLFNPAIGHLLNLWGFQQDEPSPKPPDAAAVSRWLKAAPAMAQVGIEDSRVSSSNSAVKMDFGGFAKGYSVSMAVALLVQHGVENLIVNAGGDLCVRGRHGERPWRIGIRAPDGEGVLASLELEGAQCVFTSGDYERYFEFEGKRYSHIIDPRTGYPADNTRSVTVVAGEAALADAAATALFVAGPAHWKDIARSMGVARVLLVDKAGKVYMTRNLEGTIRFERTPDSMESVDLGAPNAN
jgi:thiamine biosynthesis lipoprotein